MEYPWVFIFVLGLFGYIVNRLMSNSFPKEKKIAEALPSPKKHTYSECGTCDACQAEYIKKQMTAVQEEIRLKEKREFEDNVAKEIKEIREKNGLNVPVPKDWQKEAKMWEKKYYEYRDREVERWRR